MEINWFTVIAQIVNFLILVWLLKRFLYQPVLKAIDERQKKVASRLEDAAQSKAEALKDQELYRKKNETFDQERASKMIKVREEVEVEKERLFEKVRKESTVLSSKFEESLKQKEKAMIELVKHKTKSEVFAIAGKTLADLGGVNLEEQIIKVFIKKIVDLNDTDQLKLINALKEKNASVVLKSAFEFPEILKRDLEEKIKNMIKNDITFNYKVDPDLMSGIELITDSYQLSWNIESYLNSLEKHNNTMENGNGAN